MSSKLATTQPSANEAEFSKPTISTIVFMAFSIAFGALLILFGISSAKADEDWLLSTMMFLIPGALYALDSLIYLRRHTYRTSAGFVFGNAFLYLLLCFLCECIYFQFIYFGINEPQYKMAIPALMIAAVYAIVSCILTSLYNVFRRK